MDSALEKSVIEAISRCKIGIIQLFLVGSLRIIVEMLALLQDFCLRKW